jgi:hypothetical protein
MPGEQAEHDLIRVLDTQADSKQDTFFIAPKEIGRDGAGTQQLTLESVTEPDSPPAGEQYVFLDQSGALKAKAADGTVTTLGSGATFPDDAEYVTLSTDADLSAEKLHQNLSGTDLHDPAAHAGTHTKGSTDALNVDNLVDADTKADLTQAGGVVVSSQLSFDPDAKADLTQPGGVLVTSQLPAISITSIDVVADKTARLNLTAEEGDVAVQTDTGEAYILSTNDPTVDSNWVEITIDVLSQIAGQQITPAQVGTSSNQATIVADSVTESGNNVVTSPSADRDIFVIAAGASDPAAADADDIILEQK